MEPTRPADHLLSQLLVVVPTSCAPRAQDDAALAMAAAQLQVDAATLTTLAGGGSASALALAVYARLVDWVRARWCFFPRAPQSAWA